MTHGVIAWVLITVYSETRESTAQPFSEYDVLLHLTTTCQLLQKNPGSYLRDPYVEIAVVIVGMSRNNTSKITVILVHHQLCRIMIRNLRNF